MDSCRVDGQVSPAANCRRDSSQALPKLIGVFLYLSLLNLIGHVEGQDMHFKGDIISRRLSPPTHIQYSMRFSDASPSKSAAFSVFDTIALKGTGSSESCQVNNFLPTSQNFLIRICSGGASIVVETIIQTLSSRSTVVRYNAESGFKFVDFFQIITNLSDTGKIVALQTNGDDARLSILNYTSSNELNYTNAPLTFENVKVRNPRLAPYCTSFCRFFLYDALSDSNSSVVMVFTAGPLSEGVSLLNTFLMNSTNITKFPHKTALISQYVNTIYYLASTPLATFIYPLTLNEDNTFRNVTLEPQRASIFSGPYITYSATQTASNLNQINVIVNNSLIYFLSRYNPVTILANGLEMPKCSFDLTKPVEIVFNGSAGTIRYADAQGKGSGYIVLVRTPEGGTRPDSRCIPADGVTGVLFDKTRGEIMEVSGTSAKYFSTKMGGYSIDTNLLTEGTYSFKVKATDPQGTVVDVNKNLILSADPFSTPLRTSSIFTRMFVDNLNLELFSKGYPTVVQMSRTELMKNGGSISFVGENLISWNSFTKQVKYTLPGTAQDYPGFIRVALLRRDLLLVQKSNSSAELYNCKDVSIGSRSCQQVRKYLLDADSPRLPGEGVYSFGSGAYWLEVSLKQEAPSHSYIMRLFSTKSDAPIATESINGKILSCSWKTSGNFGQLVFLKEGSDNIIFKVSVSADRLLVTQILLNPGKKALCAKDISAIEQNADEVIVHSACPQTASTLYMYDITSSPAFSHYNREFELAANYDRITICPLFQNILYFSRERNLLRVAARRGDNLNYNFPENTVMTDLSACIPEAGVFILVRKDAASSKHFLVLYFGPNLDTEESHERIKTIIELSIEDTAGLQIRALYEVRDISIHITLIKRDSSATNVVTSFDVSIDDGEFVFKSKQNETISSLTMKYLGGFSKTTRDMAFKFSNFEPKGTVSVTKYTPLPKNKEGTFDLSGYATFEGNYNGLEIRGVGADKIEVKDRIRQNAISIPKELLSGSNQVVAAGDYVAVSKPGNKMVLYYKFFEDANRKYLTLDELPSVCEASMIEDKTKTFIILILRRTTLNGNDLVLYWLKAGLSLPNYSRDLNVYRWSQVRMFSKLRLYQTSARENAINHFVLGLTGTARGHAMVNIIQFSLDYSQLLSINRQIMEGRSVYEDIFLGKDRFALYIKVRGQALMNTKFDNDLADSLLNGGTDLLVIHGKPTIAVYCTKSSNPFCIYESHTRFFYHEGEDFKGSQEKILGFAVKAWTSSTNYIGMVVERIRTSEAEGPVFRKIVIFKRGNIGAYTGFPISGSHESVLDDELNSAFAIAEKDGEAVLLVADHLNSAEAAGLQQSATQSLPVVSNKIEVVVKDANLNSDAFKIVFKGAAPETDLVRGVYVDSGTNSPQSQETEKESGSSFWVWIAIIVGILALGILGYFAYQYFQTKNSGLKSQLIEDSRRESDVLI